MIVKYALCPLPVDSHYWHYSILKMFTQVRKLFKGSVWLSRPSHTHSGGRAVLAGLYEEQRPQELKFWF